VFPTDALSSSLGEGASQAHLRSKEALLALLHERVMDKVGATAAKSVAAAAAAAPPAVPSAGQPVVNRAVSGKIWQDMVFVITADNTQISRVSVSVLFLIPPA
jgi:hypothetical protein